MHVRVAEFAVPPENWDRAVTEIREGVLPAICQVRGIVAGFFVGDRERGISWGMVFWDSEDAMRASEEAAAGIRASAIERTGLRFTSVERFEVIAFAGQVPAAE